MTTILASEKSPTEFCPSCGKYKTLVEVIGFCVDCVKHRFPNNAVCFSCGKIEPRGQFRSLCNSCQKEKWNQENADKIEDYIRCGLTYSDAVAKVLFDNRPLCIVCGQKIKRGRKGRSQICKANKQCRTEARYYQYLRYQKGKSREDAIEVILERVSKKQAA